MSRIAKEVNRQAREIVAQGKLPTAIAMNVDTKAKMLRETLPRHFIMPSMSSGDPVKYHGVPIVVDWQIPDGEVRVS
jgi:hypothetical protein